MWDELWRVMDAMPDEFWWGALGASSLVCTIWWAVVLVGRRWERFRLERRTKRAFRGEERSERVLRRLGLIPVESQVESRWVVCLDEDEIECRLYADWIVELGGRRYVVEVKTGQRAPSIRNAATRRQLLEYSLAFDVDGVFLLDMETESLHKVSFPLVD